MTDRRPTIDRLYAAFNAREIDAALALMTAEVRWPKASEGGVVVGRDEIRAYWSRQWREFDPRVHPVAMEAKGDETSVRVHQIVKDKEGAVLFDGHVEHIYTFEDGLVSAMRLGDDALNAAPSAAFKRG